jgi:YidC/Oxa1 family membrane protein insertase
LDRNVVTATLLIGLIMMVWLLWLAPQQQAPRVDTPADSTGLVGAPAPDITPAEQAVTGTTVSPGIPVATGDSLFATAERGEEELVTVETDLYTAVLSTRGATIRSFELKEYKKFDRVTPVQLVDTSGVGALALSFTSINSHRVDSRTLYFDVDTDDRHVAVNSVDRSISFAAVVGGGRIIQTYTFSPDSYEIILTVDQENPGSFATREGYQLIWDGALQYSEDSPQTEAQNSGAFVRSGGSVASITLLRRESNALAFNGQVDWVAVKNQYFTSIMMPVAETRGAELLGARSGEPGDLDFLQHFEAVLEMRPQESEAHTFRLFLGPMEYKLLAAYDLNLYEMVDYGWNWMEWMVRPLATLVFIPLFGFLNSFIPSYGVIIIILSVLIKFVTYPLTKKSFRSMAKMRDLQPQMEAIKEKYGDNPQKQQEAMMKMYKETGVNPLGGCMPMLLQYPIIIALWRFLPQAIEIRQQGFLWASDLSAPDKILQLPFEIPFYGDFVAGFTLLMGLSMIVQMKVQMASTPSNPQMKIITYLMPVMIFAIFNRFASGLSLYYLCYNVLTAVQQKWINRSLEKEKEKNAASNGAGLANAGKIARDSKSSTNGKPGGKKGKSGSGKKLKRP